MSTPSERTSRGIRAARVNRRPPGLAATLVALAIIFTIAWMFFLRSGPAAPAPVVGGIQGTYRWTHDGKLAEDQAGRFSAVAAGDAGGRERPRGDLNDGAGELPGTSYVWLESSYDADARTEDTREGARSDEGRYERTIGAWPPVWGTTTHSPLDYQGLAAIVRTAVEERDASVGVKPFDDDGRAVWRAAMTLGGRPRELVVDQATGIVTWYSDGASTFTATVDGASPPPAGQTYEVRAPEGAEVTTTRDEAYAYAASPADAGRAAGYVPLVSDLAPDGYRLKAVATVRSRFRPTMWLPDDGAGEGAGERPLAGPAEPAVAALYTRGLNWFTVEQIGPDATGYWGAALRSGMAAAATDRPSYRTEVLQYGALSGMTAATWYQASGPSLLLVGQRRAVFVTGALTRQELISFAEGLRIP